MCSTGLVAIRTHFICLFIDDFPQRARIDIVTSRSNTSDRVAMETFAQYCTTSCTKIAICLESGDGRFTVERARYLKIKWL